MTFEQLRSQKNRLIKADVYHPPAVTYMAFRAGTDRDNCGHKHQTVQAALKCAHKCGATRIQGLTDTTWEYTQ